jgi:arylsulfatase
MKRTSFIASAITAMFLTSIAAVSTAADKPNIVLVFMDNFGWGEPGFNGGGIIRGAPTPRLDKLASEEKWRNTR